MKKSIIVCVVIMCLFIGGCGKVTKTNENITEKSTVVEGSDFIGVIPDPGVLFSNKIQVYDDLAGEHYGFYIMGGDKAVYDKYVSECKNGSFTDEKYNIDSGAENGNTFQAFTSDKKYKIDIVNVVSSKYVMVTVTRK